MIQNGKNALLHVRNSIPVATLDFPGDSLYNVGEVTETTHIDHILTT
jgi:hypothetical protein